MEMTIDFANLKDSEVLEPGTYSAQVSDFMSGTTRAGKPKVIIVFSLLDDCVVGRTVYADFALSNNALPFLRRALVALGFDMTELRGEIKLKAEDMVGIRCRIVIENTITANGTYNRVKSVMRQRDEDMDKSLDGSEIADFWLK